MKKLFFALVTVAIVALVFINLNLVLNKGSKVNVALTSMLSLAQNEGGGDGNCYQIHYFEPHSDWSYNLYICGPGSETVCGVGYRITEYVQYQGFVITEEEIFWLNCSL